MDKVNGKDGGIDRPVSRFPILTYHSIDDSGSVISTSPPTFRRQMQSLSELGYKTIPLRDLYRVLAKAQPLPGRTVVLTFDDGFHNFITEAHPVLSEFGFTATVFLVTDFCGKHNDWAGNPPDISRSELLSWAQIRDLDKAGIEFGSHTRTHTDLTRLSAKNVDAELKDSKAQIADKLGRETMTFAYPYGRTNTVVRETARANYRAACSTNLGKVSRGSDTAMLSRIDTYYLGNQKVFAALPSARFDNYMLFRHTMRRIKSAVVNT